MGAQILARQPFNTNNVNSQVIIFPLQSATKDVATIFCTLIDHTYQSVTDTVSSGSHRCSIELLISFLMEELFRTPEETWAHLFLNDLKSVWI